MRGFIVSILQKLFLAGWLVGKLVRKSLSPSFKSNCGNFKLITVIINANDDYDDVVVAVVVVVVIVVVVIVVVVVVVVLIMINC